MTSDQLAIIGGTGFGLAAWLAYRRSIYKGSGGIVEVAYEAVLPPLDCDDGIGQEVRASMAWSIMAAGVAPIGTFLYYSLRAPCLRKNEILRIEGDLESQLQETIGQFRP